MESMEIQDRPIEEIMAEREPKTELEIIDIEDYKTEVRLGDSYLYRIPLDKLTIHPLNTELHGDNPVVYDLIISIPEYGLKEPLLITPDRMIVDGRRRHKALRILRQGTVQCEVDFELDDEDKVFQRILIADQQKPHSPEYIYKASKRMEEIESERAKQRMSMGGKGSPLTDDLIGRTDTKIAKFFNIGRTKLRQIWEIYDKKDDHLDIVKALNNGTLKVAGAWEKIVKSRDEQSKFQEKKDDFFKVIDNVKRTSLGEFLFNKYSNDDLIRKTSPQELREEIRKELGQPVGEDFESMWKALNDDVLSLKNKYGITGDTRIRRWNNSNSRYISLIIRLDEQKTKPRLELEHFKETAFIDFKKADAYAEEKGGYCEGKVSYGALPYWRLWLHPPLLEKEEEP